MVACLDEGLVKEGENPGTVALAGHEQGADVPCVQDEP
jgi:hypothetical protein